MAIFLFSIFNWLIRTSVFAAVCAVALCHGALLLFEGEIHPNFWPLYALVAGGTLVEYNVHHLYTRWLQRMGAREILKNNAGQVVNSAIGSLLICIAILQLPWTIVLVTIISGVLGTAYSNPILPFATKRRIKDYGLMKIIVLTSVWVVVTTLLPAMLVNYYGDKLWVACTLRFLLIFPLCIAFDIRDTSIDAREKIRTVPIAIGMRRSYLLADLTLLIFAIGGMAWYSFIRIYPMAITILVTAIAARQAIQYSRRKPTAFAYLFLVDGVMLLFGVLSIIAQE